MLGCYVIELSESDIDQVFPALALLEAKVADEACRRPTSADFAALKTSHAELEAAALARNVDRFFCANPRFQACLQAIAGNR